MRIGTQLRKLDKFLYPITSKKPMRHKRAKGKPTVTRSSRPGQFYGITDTRKRKNVKR